MRVYINGKLVQVEDGLNLAQLVRQRGLEPETIIIEFNEQIVPHETWADIDVSDSDKIEILRFVGGG